MTPPKLKKALRERRLTIGSWMTFQFPPIAEMLARAGFDWLVVDLEHTSIDLHEAQTLMMIMENAGVEPLVRVGANDPLIIKRVMDAGAHGIIVPDVRSAEDARAAAASMFYPPRGTRGAGLGRAQGYGMDFDGYLEWLRESAVLIVQIEHVDAVDNLDDILAVDEVDAFMIGPYDLSASIGKPGRFNAPDVMELVGRVTGAIQKSRKVGGIHVVHPDPRQLRTRIDEGYRLIAYGDDMVVIARALADLGHTLREFRNG